MERAMIYTSVSFNKNQNTEKLVIFYILSKKRSLSMSCRPSDDQLKLAISGIFDKYDSDKSGTLEL